MNLVYFFFHPAQVFIQRFHLHAEPLLAKLLRAALLLQGRAYSGKPGHDEAPELGERGAELRRFFHVFHMIFEETVELCIFALALPRLSDRIQVLALYLQ